MYEMDGPPLLAQTAVNSHYYQTEYRQRYEGRREGLIHNRVPTALNAWKPISRRPESCHAINPPRLAPLDNPYTVRHIPTSESVRNYRRMLHSEQGSRRFDMQGQPWEGGAFQRSNTEQGLRTSRLELPRPKSEMTRYAKTFPYISSQCFFHPANESTRRYFVVDRDWASESKQYRIKKNNLFA